MYQLVLQMWLRLTSLLFGNALMVGNRWTVIAAALLVVAVAILIETSKEE